jgi:hypothetical protein
VARLLLDGGATVDQANDVGAPPLIWACCIETQASDITERIEKQLKVVQLLLERGASPSFEANLCHNPCNEHAVTHLQQWRSATPGRREAVGRHGWEYVDAPYEWTPANHAQFPTAFQEWVWALCLAWQGPFAAWGNTPGPFAEMAAKEEHARMGLLG